MRYDRGQVHSLRLLLCTACTAAALALAGCGSSTGTGSVPTPAPGSAGSGALGATPALATLAPPPQGRQLLVWLTDDVNTAPDTAAGESLAQAIRQFEQSHANVDVQWQVMPATGQPSLVAFLKSAQQIAPSILPDVVLLDSRSLWQLADLGLVPPLEPAFLARWEDFYPFAVDATLYNGVHLGVPYAADVQHLAYVTDQVTQPPVTWQQLSEQRIPYLFPVAGTEGADAALLQYVGAGGELREDLQAGDAEPLQALFAFLEQARSQGVIAATIQEQAGLAQVWAALTSGEATAANVAASKFRRGGESNAALGYGQVPTENGLPTAVAQTWALAVTATDPEQRSLAMDFMEHLLQPVRHANWSQAADRLPTRRPAFAAWSNRGDYHAFLEQLLEVAVAPPAGAPFADFAQRLRDAQLAVLRGEMSADQAMQSMAIGP